jgi:hypothetical protein
VGTEGAAGARAEGDGRVFPRAHKPVANWLPGINVPLRHLQDTMKSVTLYDDFHGTVIA